MAMRARSAQRSAGFDDFAQAHWQRLVRTSLLLGCAPSDAEDLAQACLVKALVAWPRVQKADDPTRYVYKILINTWRSEARKAARARDASSMSAQEPVFDSSTVELAISMRAAIARLNQRSREVLILRYYLDLSEKETADLLGVPPGTIKSRLARAVSALSTDAELIVAEKEAT